MATQKHDIVTLGFGRWSFRSLQTLADALDACPLEVMFSGGRMLTANDDWQPDAALNEDRSP